MNRNVVDDWEHRVNDMARAAEDRQQPGRDRRVNRDALRVAAQELLCVFEHDRKAARRLQITGAGDDRDDRQHDGDWRRARLITEGKYINDETDTTDNWQTQTAVTYTDNQARQQDTDTKYQDKLPFL